MEVKECQLDITMHCVIDIWARLLKSEPMMEESIEGSSTALPLPMYIYSQLEVRETLVDSGLVSGAGDLVPE